MVETVKKKLGRLILWFDAGAAGGGAELTDRVDWVRVLPFIGMHLACAAVFWVGWSSAALAAAFGLYAIRMFAITGFYHRYFSHRTFKTSRVAQFVFALIGASSVQRGPLWWAAHHRKHHRHSDGENDVHSPHQHGFWWSHMGWITSPRNFPTDFDEVRDLSRYSELRFLDRFDIIVPFVLAVGLFLIGGAQLLVWGFFVSTIALFHCTCFINSLAHQFGTQRYDTGDQSRNNFLLALLTFGEGWHNNHHKFPGSTRQGFFWWEIDLTFYGLRALEALGVIKDLRQPPKRILGSA